MEQVEEIKAKATTECQDLKSSIAKLESELETSTLQVGSLQAKLDTNLKESQDLQNQLKTAKTHLNQHEKEIQAKNKEVEELKLQSERYQNTKDYYSMKEHSITFCLILLQVPNYFGLVQIFWTRTKICIHFVPVPNILCCTKR